MKVSFRNIAKSLTGISTPLFGVNWNPPRLDIDTASSLLTFLEDRRVLYNPYHIEEPARILESVQEIRERLTRDLEMLDRGGDLANLLRAMRSACRRFLDQTQQMRLPRILYGSLSMTRQEEPFFIALGFFRATFGLYLAELCVRYGLDVETDLATILPTIEDDGPLHDRLSE